MGGGGLHTAVFLVVAASDLCEENLILAENGKVRKRVSAADFKSLRKRKCLQKREGSNVFGACSGVG